MKCGFQMAVAIAAGYLLGRSHKIQLAALLALSAAAGGKLPIDERELLRHTPLGAPLDKLTADLRGQLVESGIAAAKKAASSGIESFSDKLQQRAETMRGTGTTMGAEAGEPEEPARRERAREEPARRERAREQEPDEASAEYERGEPDYREEPRPARRPTRTEPRRRAPRWDDDRPRRGRAPR
jgi:hypothetical protein